MLYTATNSTCNSILCTIPFRTYAYPPPMYMYIVSPLLKIPKNSFWPGDVPTRGGRGGGMRLKPPRILHTITFLVHTIPFRFSHLSSTSSLLSSKSRSGGRCFNPGGGGRGGGMRLNSPRILRTTTFPVLFARAKRVLNMGNHEHIFLGGEFLIRIPRRSPGCVCVCVRSVPSCEEAGWSGAPRGGFGGFGNQRF